MWNCSALLSKNGSIFTKKISLTKDCSLQKCIELTLKRRSFQTSALSEKHSNGQKIGRCRINWRVELPKNNLSVRRFHASLMQNDIENSSKNKNLESKNLLKSHETCIEEMFIEQGIDSTVEDYALQDKKNSQSLDHSFEWIPQKHKRKQTKSIESMYPQPVHQLQNIYSEVKRVLNQEALIITYKPLKSKGWKCTLNVTWPENNSWTAQADKKNDSSRAASLKCLEWLESKRKLKYGKPILYEMSDLKKLQKVPRITLSTDMLNAANNLLDEYQQKIQPLIEANPVIECAKEKSLQSQGIIDPVGTSNPANHTDNYRELRNQYLQLRYQDQLARPISSYPITEYRDQILEGLENNDVLVIKGDTGCGKSTQVPQYILDSFIKDGRGTECNMIVSQPRRISATSLAERVAEERMEELCDVIGYQVRLNQELPNTPGGILFCTTGILLRKLQFNPTLEGCSHVIIDEAHERTINTDMLLTLLKRIRKQRPSLKVIIMSATINAGLFEKFFDCKTINIPGRIYPVEMHFLEDIEKLSLNKRDKWQIVAEESEAEKFAPTPDIQRMSDLISWICDTKPPGGILCFLPGWSDLCKMEKCLQDQFQFQRNKISIFKIHSKMNHEDQKKIFKKYPNEQRKIILATNIAETGITITDVVYVVDSCIDKRLRWHEERYSASIDSSWASQANIKQRMGRAGRVKPGESYHFITRDKFEKLPKFPEPEIKESSLEKTILDVKTYTNEKAIEFIKSMPEAPSYNRINAAVRELRDLGALDSEENLTPLGKKISVFALDPHLSKVVVFSSIFQCVSPMMTISSAMSGEVQIFRDILENKSGMRYVKSKFHPTSDHISIARLFQNWYDIQKKNHMKAQNFAFKLNLVPKNVYTLSKVRELNAESLFSTGMLSDTRNLDSVFADENRYAEVNEICRGVFLAGLNRILTHQDFDIKKGRIKKDQHVLALDDGSRATITPESVNFKRENWPTSFLTYSSRTHSEIRRTTLIRETSLITPLTVFLFNQGQIIGHQIEEMDSIQGDSEKTQEIEFYFENKKKIKIRCSKEIADVLLRFRNMIWDIVRYILVNGNHIKSEPTSEVVEVVNDFRSQMLLLLSKMLTEAATSLDTPKRLTLKHRLGDDYDDYSHNYNNDPSINDNSDDSYSSNNDYYTNNRQFF